MAVKSGMFNSIRDPQGIGDRKYEASFFASYFSSFVGNGVFPNPSNGMQVMAGENMNTVIKAGKGWINGYYIINDSDFNMKHDNSDGVLKRIDRIVMRLNFLERTIEFVLLKGEISGNPVPKELTRNTDYYELALADVMIEKGAISISQSNITDNRLNNNLCGIVHGVVDQVDTTTIFNQYASWYTSFKTEKQKEFEEWLQGQTEISEEKQKEFDDMLQADHEVFLEKQQEFDDWMASIADILNENVAGNLLKMIEDHEKKEASASELGHVKVDGKNVVLEDGLLKVKELDSIVVEVQATTKVSEILINNLNYTEIDFSIEGISEGETNLVINENVNSSYSNLSIRFGTSYSGTSAVTKSMSLGLNTGGVNKGELRAVRRTGVALINRSNELITANIFKNFLNDNTTTTISSLRFTFTVQQPIGTKITLKCR